MKHFTINNSLYINSCLIIAVGLMFGMVDTDQISIGDENSVILGGLFPVHTNGISEKEPCGEILLEKGIQRLEAMLYAIDQINQNRTYYPFRLGAIIVDTCSSDSYALQQSLQFLETASITNCTRCRKVKAVVGAANSAVSEAVATIFRLFKIPQVSYASTSKEFDDTHKYPYFFRVVPSDAYQIKVILDILIEFKWTFVSTVASKGEYGETAIESLKDLISNSTNNDICFAAKVILERDPTDDNYDDAVRRLSLHEEAKVVIVFLNEDKINHLLDACHRYRISEDRFIWIGSDGWGAKDRVVKGNEHLVKGAITILPKRYPIDGFDEYFTSLTPETNTRNPWFEEFWETQFNCQFNTMDTTSTIKCTGKEDLKANYKQEGLVPMVIDAVYLLAEATKTICSEDTKFCSYAGSTLYEYKMRLKETLLNIKMPSMQGHDMEISFDPSRSIPVNYSIYQYQKVAGLSDKYEYVPIGEWDKNRRLRIQEYPVWTVSPDAAERPPLSRCNEECERGEERILPREHPNRRCCYTCRPCKDLHYLPNPYSPCLECPKGHIASPDKSACMEIVPRYLGEELSSPWPLVPLVFSILGLISTFIVIIIFFTHHTTPVIMASGRELCYIILVGIIFCYSYTFIILLKPTTITCGILRVGMGLGLSICYSAIFIKTNRLSRIFEVSLRITKRPSYISPGSQIIICMCLILIQITLTTLWLIVRPPDIADHPFSNSRMIVCGFDSLSVFIGLLYNMILIVLCTVYAYKTRNLPENFNESKCISFTMYSSCIVWLAFVPIYYSAKEYKVQSTILCMCVSLSGTITLACLFLPKIYVVLFQPEKNIRYNSSSGNTGTDDTRSASPAVRFLRSAPSLSGQATQHKEKTNKSTHK
ncbi:metabotropic glutamate receptor 3 isoform X1 [Parasteatoda tepidariorum]|nr:metabotropic glutamate receptor 3 isoform X1 [Parasteatoda tepidariorum]